MENKTYSRRDFFKFSGAVLSTLALGACTPANGASSAVSNSAGEPHYTECTKSYPGATVLGIAGDPNAHVTVDQGNNGSIEYSGAAVNAPGLQYNEGAKGLDGSQVGQTITDYVCVDR